MESDDAQEFGPVVDSLVGQECERTLATNSIKLRFGTERDARGDSYIWIDPPWMLKRGDIPIASSSEYSEKTFAAWSKRFTPLDRAVLAGWSVGHDGTTFKFGNGYKIVVPSEGDVREDDYWYAHWYARHTDRKVNNS